MRTTIIQRLDFVTKNLLDRIQLADEYSIKEWLHQAFLSLATRPGSITPEEGQRLGRSRLAALNEIRKAQFLDRERNCYNPFYLGPDDGDVKRMIEGHADLA